MVESDVEVMVSLNLNQQDDQGCDPQDDCLNSMLGPVFRKRCFP